MDILKKLNEFESWKDLNSETKTNIIKNSTFIEHKKETTLYLESNPNPLIYLILSGYVILSKISSDGKEKYLYYMSKGDLINEYAIDGKPTTASAKVSKSSELISIHKDVFLDLMEKDFKLCSLVLNSLTLKVRRSQRQILNLGVYSTNQRIISNLLKLSRDYGREIDGYILIEAPLNQTDLSYMVGASRETVNRSLKELESKGLISFVGHKIAILNREELLNQIL